MSELNRRDFVKATVALACACCSCELLAADAATAPAATTGAKTVDVGAMSDFSKDAVSDKWAKTDKFFIIRHEGRIYAPSSICTHKRNTLKLKEGTITCPAHGSKFTELGVPTKGPAKIPLYRYKITKDEKGNLVVDKTKQFDEKDWEQEGAFVKVD